MNVRVGISGWRYAPWRGVFYPPGLVQKRELAYAAESFSTIEVNGSFYSLLRPSTYERWHDETPASFVFALKGSRYITHMLRLANVDAALANFFASGVLALGQKLGPILWQLPERVALDLPRLRAFFRKLPRDHASAARLAKKHDERLEGRSLVKTRARSAILHAIEPRHPSFGDAAFRTLARDEDIAVVHADSAGRFPVFEMPETTHFTYTRLHGSEELYVSGYRDDELRVIARRLQKSDRDAFVYFDNDVQVRAPFDALRLDAMLQRRDMPGLPASLGGVTERARSHWPAWTRR